MHDLISSLSCPSHATVWFHYFGAENHAYTDHEINILTARTNLISQLQKSIYRTEFFVHNCTLRKSPTSKSNNLF